MSSNIRRQKKEAYINTSSTNKRIKAGKRKYLNEEYELFRDMLIDEELAELNAALGYCLR